MDDPGRGEMSFDDALREIIKDYIPPEPEKKRVISIKHANRRGKVANLMFLAIGDTVSLPWEVDKLGNRKDNQSSLLNAVRRFAVKNGMEFRLTSMPCSLDVYRTT